MPEPYEGVLSPGINEFDYNGTHYESEDSFGPFTSCELKGFINAVQAANPDKGFREEHQGIIDQLETECPTVVNNAGPVPDNNPNPPNENPPPNGEDTPGDQGAQDPPVAGNVGQQNGREVVPDSPPDEEPTRPEDGEEDGVNNGEQPQEQTNAGDPVDIFNGAFYLQETDLTIPNTIVPMAFTRIYRSGRPYFGPFGWNWDHNFNLYLRELTNGNVVLWRNLNEATFTFDGAKFEPPRGVFELLERLPGPLQAYEIKGKGGVLMHFERPAGWADAERIPILWFKDKHGNTLNFNYGADDKLAEVRDDDDRFFQFTYDHCRLLVSVADQAGRTFNYEHDEETRQLVCFTSPPITGHADGITRIYHYEQPWARPELRHNIIRVEDGDGNVYLENKYEQDPASWSFARLIEQLYGGFLYQFRYTQLQWVPANAIYVNIPALRVEVMNPDFGMETYTFNYRGDLLDRRYRLSKDKSFRVVAWQYQFDAQGNLTKTTQPDGSEEINTFDFAHADPRMRSNLLKKELTAASGFPSPSRIVWRGIYESITQHLREEKNETGATTSYKFDYDLTPAAPNNTGKLMKVIHPDATLPDGTLQLAVTNFKYNSKGQIVETELPDGTRHTLEYGIAGTEKSRVIKKIYDSGNLNIEHSTKYDSFGFVHESIDGMGNSKIETFNALGLLERSKLPQINGHISEQILHYNSDRKVILSERPKGTLVDPTLVGNHIHDKFDRDVLGFPVKYILSSNTINPKLLLICNDFRGLPVEIANPDGSKVKTIFDERGLALSSQIIGTDDKTITTKKSYDRTGRLVSETNLFGLTKKYEYDGFSRVSKILLPNGTEIHNKWLKNNLLESEEIIGNDGIGNIRQLSFKSYNYDEKNRKTSEITKSFAIDPLVSTDISVTYFYDQMDRVIKIVGNKGEETILEYDGLGRNTKETDSMGNQRTNIFDKNGNRIKVEELHNEPDGSVSTISKEFKFDEHNRNIELIEPDGSKLINEFDDRNLLIKQTDALGSFRTMSYDSFNNKISENQDPIGLNIVHKWTFDNLSRITEYEDPTGQKSNYFYDSVGRNVKTVYSNGFNSIKTYNDFNQIVKERLGSGTEFEYSYDSTNRVKSITNNLSPNPIKKVDTHEFGYDGLDRTVMAKTGTSSVIRKYDSLGRLISENTLGDIISCKYDDQNSEMFKLWPDGRTEKFTYNSNGVLSAISETVGGTLGSSNVQIASFNNSGPVAPGDIQYQGGTTIKNKYDERKRLTEMIIQSAVGTQEEIKYRYNRVDTKQVEALLGQNPKTSYFEYDSRYRLKEVKENFQSQIPLAKTQTEHDTAINIVKSASTSALNQEKFEYNNADDRVKYEKSGNPDKNYTYHPGHKIKNDGANTYNHSQEGTLIRDGVFKYDIDALGRIVAIKSGVTKVAAISYDAFGRPSIIKEAGKPELSLNYLGDFVVQEKNNGIPSKQISINPTNGIPIAYHMPGDTRYTLFDNRLNLIGLLNSTGDLIETYRYNSFGLPLVYDSTGSIVASSAFGVDPIFGGQRYISSTGFYLSKRRLMNPGNGLFLSPDPMGYIDSPSLYVYAGQNPVDNVDPDGELAFLAGLLIAAVVGAVVSGGVNAIRQGIAISEGSQEGWEWGQFGASVGIGAVAGPLLVVAPELAVPLAIYGVGNGIAGIADGNYGTGAFDIVTSVLPFGFKGVRNATFGRGTVYGQARGLGPSASVSARTGRFGQIGNTVLNKRFFRGTTYYEALEASEAGLNLDVVLGRQHSAAAPPRLGPGLYLTEALEPPVQGSAPYWADVHGGSGSGGGPAVIEGSIPRLSWLWLRRQPGVQSAVEQPNFPSRPSNLETYVPEQNGLANWFNQRTSWQILPENNVPSPYGLGPLFPSVFSGVPTTILEGDQAKK